MDIYGISDLHLTTSSGQDMAAYSGYWNGHPEAMFELWDAAVPDDALVLIPGDISLAVRKEDIVSDYAHVEERPGRIKIVSNGNHDFTIWSTQGAARKALALYPSLLALKNGAERIAVGAGAGVVVAALRGAINPDDHWFRDERGDAKRFTTETRRLELVLERTAELRQHGDKLILMVHYPPFINGHAETIMSEMIEAAGVDLCVFGHVHVTTDEQWGEMFEGRRGPTEYRLLSADYLRLQPRLLGQLTDQGLTVA